jgi:hypothetical protein
MAKRFFIKCFGCFCGYECGKTPRLARKKKKQLKNFRLLYDKYCYKHYMDNATICNIVDDFKRFKKIFFLEPFIKKYSDQIDFIRKTWEDESIFIDENGRLSWYWESDDDYGGSSGLMPFCYNEEDAGRTWAFSEVKSLVRSILDYPKDFVFPKEIKSDKDLLEFVKKNMHDKENHS